MVGVVDIDRVVDVFDYVLKDEGLWLSTEGVDAGTVVHVAGIMVDVVAIDLIASHAVNRLCPPPTEVDAGIRHLANFVMSDDTVRDIAAADAETAPILIRHIIYIIISDDESVADNTAILWVVWQVCLKSRR